MFEKSGFPRIDAIFSLLKGPRFVPNGKIMLTEAVANAGKAAIPDWTGNETNELTWNDDQGDPTPSSLRWQDAVDWLRQELFSGRLIAYWIVDGVLREILPGQFTENDIEHMFRLHQQDAWPILVDRDRLSACLIARQQNTTPPARRGRGRVPDPDLKAAFLIYKSDPNSNLTRDGIKVWGQAKFGPRITTTRLSELYQEVKPNGGNKRGPKSKQIEF